MEKTCYVCGVPKDINEFYANPRMKDGHYNKCKACTKAETVAYRAAHLEQVRAYNRKYNRKRYLEKSHNPNQLVLPWSAPKKLCKRCGGEFELKIFSKDRAGQDGLQSWCKACRATHDANYMRDPDNRRKRLDAQSRLYHNTDEGRKVRARSATRRAIKKGLLVKGPCESHGCKGEKVVAHHDDYNEPLDVRWFCREHHLEHHDKVVFREEGSWNRILVTAVRPGEAVA